MLRKRLERAGAGSLGNANGGLRELGSYKGYKQMNKPLMILAPGRGVTITLPTTNVGS